jgi:hypothetical protein
MAYVDLNPVRAGIASSLIGADFTSVQQRLFEFAKDQHAKKADSRQRPILLPFTATTKQSDDGIPFNVQDYLELVDTAGTMRARRQTRCDCDDRAETTHDVGTEPW